MQLACVNPEIGPVVRASARDLIASKARETT